MNLQRANKEEIQKKARAYLKGKNWHKAWVFLNFVVLAFVFWLIQYYQETFEVETAVAIEYTDVPTGVVLDQSIPKQVSLKLRDKGTSFINYNINKRKDKIQISLKGIDTESTSYLVSHSILNTAIRNHILSSTSLLSFYPDNIIVNYLPLKSKELPVVLTGKVTPAQGFLFVDSLLIDPPMVTVYADSITLDTLKWIKTAPIEKTNVNKSLDMESKLAVPENATLSVDKVRLRADVEEYTEKTFSVPINIEGMPNNVNVRFFPSEVDVVCYIPLRNYSHLSAGDLEINLNYADLQDVTSNSIILELTAKPDYLTYYRIAPEKTDFLIEQQKK